MTNVNRLCKIVKSDGHHDPLTGIGLDFWDGPTTRGVNVVLPPAPASVELDETQRMGGGLLIPLRPWEDPPSAYQPGTGR